MTGNSTDQTQDRLELRSRISDVAQLSTWIDGLALRYAISADLRFSMILCLEEVLSNVIRHGYAGAEDRPIEVRFAAPRPGWFEFIVDDEATHFNPVQVSELPPVNPDDIRVGGQGIRLLRHFASAVEYEPTPRGNRLRIVFSSPVPL